MDRALRLLHADGPDGSAAKCAGVEPLGSISFQGRPGSFTNMLSLAFSIRKAAGGGPNIKVNIGTATVGRWVDEMPGLPACEFARSSSSATCTTSHQWLYSHLPETDI